jgi:hypothetical protein
MVAFRRAVLPILALVSLLVPAARADNAKKNPFSGVPMSGTSADGNAFQGTMDVLGFINDNGLKAIASLTGTITPASGAAQQVTGALVLVPVKNAAAAAPTGFGGTDATGGRNLRIGAAAAQQQASCPILNLDLGPLDLNLLGLTVHLNEVVLDITAVPGAGNLLGNLLCAVANLLNGLNLNLLGTAVVNVLTQLLNNVVAALAGL